MWGQTGQKSGPPRCDA